MNAARASNLNKYIVTNYFKKLKEWGSEIGAIEQPHSIFNMDEKEFA